MNGIGYKESDWRLFKERLPLWQENYMDRLTQEYVALLTGPGAASDRFWALHDRIRQDKKSVGVIARMSRSEMELNILRLLREGAITPAELEGFSEELREKMMLILSRD